MHITIKDLKTVLLIAATLFVTGFSCNKEGSRPCTMVTPYNFNVTGEFNPQQEVYNVGDTIYVSSTFSKKMTNLVSYQQTDYSNSLGIVGNISTSLLDTANKEVKYALDKFIVFDLIGKTSELQNQNILNAGKNLLFFESNNGYELKIGFILKQKGLYMIGISDLGSQGLRGKDCTNAGFNMTVTNSNKNLHLFEYALGYPADAMLAKNIFCFRVQ